MTSELSKFRKREYYKRKEGNCYGPVHVQVRAPATFVTHDFLDQICKLRDITNNYRIRLA